MRVFLFTFFVALFLGTALYASIWYTRNHLQPANPLEAAVEVGNLEDLFAEKMSNLEDKDGQGSDDWDLSEDREEQEINELKDGDSRGLPANNGPVVKKQKKARGTPRPKVDKSIHDFGSIDEGEIITHHFQILNRGNAPLKIIDFEVGCGCTMVEFPRTPIPAGKSIKIKAVFDSHDKLGPQKKMLRLKTNGTPKNVDMYFKGWVYPKDFGKDKEPDSTTTEKAEKQKISEKN